MMGWLKRTGVNGPVTHTAARAQQCTGNRRRTQQDQRTVVDQDEAAQTARLLAIVEELRQPVSAVSARRSSTLALQTDSRPTSMREGGSRLYRESAARGV